MKCFKMTAILCASAIFALNTGCNNEPPGSETAEPTTAATAAAEEAAADVPETTEFKGVKMTDGFDPGKYSTFELSSEDLHDGVWDTAITNTEKGENRSPQLSWAPVDGAGCYAVFMTDTSAGNWLHWKSVTGTGTVLPAGWAPSSEYVGPYPPSGTHDYEVYVFALREQPERIKGGFDSSNPKLFEFFEFLDGEGGNIVGYGHILGTYTHGD